MGVNGVAIGRLQGGPAARLTTNQVVSRATFFVLVLFSLVVCAVYLHKVIEWSNRPFAGFLYNYRAALGYTSQYHWSGSLAGLKYPDRIVAANGRPIRSAVDLDPVIHRTRVGEMVAYTVQRGEERFEISLPTTRFTATDLVLTYGIPFLEGGLFLIMGVLVYLLKPDRQVSWIFFLGCLDNSLGTILGFDLESTHLGFTKEVMLINFYGPAIFIHLGMIFPQKMRLLERYRYLPVLPYIVSTALVVPMMLLYPKPVALKIHGFSLLYLIFAAAFFIASCLKVYWKGSSALARQRAKVILLGAAVGFPAPAIAFFLASTGATVAGMKVATNFAHLPVFVFPLAVAYSIAKHNLFDVDVYIKRTVGYAMMTVLVAGAYSGVQVLLRSFVLGPFLGEGAEKVFPVVFAVLIVFLFNPLNRSVQGVVDRMFYRKRSDYKEIVLSVTEALSSMLNLQEISRKIVHTVRDVMFIEASGLVLAGAQGETLRGYFVRERGSLDGAGKGSVEEEDQEARIPADDPLVELVSRERKMITKYDVAEDPRFREFRVSCGKRFEELSASIAIPLLHRGEFKGLLAVGHKKSGHFFTREDVELLQTLAGHGAVSIESARMADQMKKDETVRTNLSRYLSPQIVDRIVQNDVQVNLGGVRKAVTILFSDIRNFTTITESRPPDELIHILNEYFTEMAAVIFEHQGSLDKYIGDAIVSVFGSLIPLENPAHKAVAAAVAMMKRLPELNRRWEARYGFYMNIGIGVNTGEVFLGNIGSPERMEFTVIGDAVNVASRFSGLAKGGQIFVTEETFRLVGEQFRFRSLPPVEVKGKSGKMDVYEVLY